MADALTTDDYAALHAMQTSNDPQQQAQASALAKKLTPPEQQAFFDYQKSQHPQGERGRVDNQIAGLPPEMVAAMALPIAKVATQAGLTTGQRIGSTFKAALGTSHPLVKYEITRSALTHLGLPAPLSMAVAMAVSGYKTGIKDAAETAPAEAAGPSATAPAPASPPAAAAAPAAAGAARVDYNTALGQVKDAFTKAGLTPQPAELNNAASLVRYGKTAEEALARVLQQRTMNVQDAAAKLAEKFGTPSDATVAAKVAARNASRRWN